MGGNVISRRIALEVPANTRDLGGMIGIGGRKIVSGKLFRSGNLYGASEADLKYLAENVALVVDLRSDKEREEKPDPVIEGAESLWLPVFEKREIGGSRDKQADRTSFEVAAKAPDMARDKMLGVYKRCSVSEHTLSQYSRLVKLLLEPRDKAVLWHCTAGKDRTGIGSLIIQTLLGVSREDILADYLKTNEYIKEEVSGLYKLFEKRLGGLDERTETALGYLFGAHKEYLDAVYDTTEAQYGSFDAFLEKGLGISPAERAKLQEMYLEQA